jgi:hypothetical protein
MGFAFALGASAGCDLSYPEVIIVNQTTDTMQLKNPSFSGCIWNHVLAYGDATSPKRCLPGDDRIHFQRFNAEAYCQDRIGNGTLAGTCPCDGGTATALDGGIDAEPPNIEPTWFNYQTISSRHASYGQLYRFEVTLADLEQDFSIPGPYGH